MGIVRDDDNDTDDERCITDIWIVQLDLHAFVRKSRISTQFDSECDRLTNDAVKQMYDLCNRMNNSTKAHDASAHQYFFSPL